MLAQHPSHLVRRQRLSHVEGSRVDAAQKRGDAIRTNERDDVLQPDDKGVADLVVFLVVGRAAQTLVAEREANDQQRRSLWVDVVWIRIRRVVGVRSAVPKRREGLMEGFVQRYAILVGVGVTVGFHHVPGIVARRGKVMRGGDVEPFEEQRGQTIGPGDIIVMAGVVALFAVVLGPETLCDAAADDPCRACGLRLRMDRWRRDWRR